MALREGTRRWAMRAAWVALLVASSVLIGLRVGRPLCYTDGARSLDGRTLAGSGMLQWRSPEVVAEVPGPVAGRVAALPDGRLIYGRLGDDGTSDLVTWDPARAMVPPEPVYALNTPNNELAPAVGADGRIWFASDRDGGAGGYDLWVAPGLAAAAGEVAPVPACRTALDETDPAPHPNGVDLVFVRIDRRIAGGNDGVLWRWRFGDPLDPVPVFAPPPRRGQRTIARDPVFAADGAALWFVRRTLGEPLALARASLQNGVYDDPVAVGVAWPARELRSPAPAADGRSLALLLGKTAQHPADLWYVARAQEVYPWWPGQRWLEWLLLGVIAASVLLLVLLHLGRRWGALDLVAQCLLLSLLLHVLLFLWLMGVEIVGSLAADGDDAGGLEVSVVASAAGATASGGAGAGSEVDDAVRFTPDERSLAADAPGTSPTRADAPAALAPEAGEWERANEARTVATATALADAADAAAPRDGADPSAQVLQAAPGAPDTTAGARAAAAPTARGAHSPDAVEVVVPGSGVARAAPERRALEAPAASPAAALAVPGPAANAAAAAPVLREAPVVATNPRAAASGGGGAAEAPLAAASMPAAATTVAPGAGAQPVAAQRARADVAPDAAAGAAVPRPGSALARPKPSGGAAASAPGPAPLAAPVARAAAVPLAGTMRDAPSAAATPRGDAIGHSQAARAPAGSAPASAPASAPGSAPGSAHERAPVAAADVPAVAPAASSLARPQRAVAAGASGERALTAGPPRTQLARGAGSGTAVAPALAPSLAPASAYSTRFGPAKAKALEEFGGTADTERAVANGLRYLAKIQNADGSWGDRESFDGKYGFVSVGKTALCVLAFLGAGHTPQSKTEHSDVVRRAVAHLLSLQDDAGAFGPSSCYGHGIATYAITECYGITKDRELVRPIERALTWILDNQGPRRDRRNRGGWGYFSPGLQREDDYARVSVSAWMIMALESARLSGVELPPEVLPAAREYLELSYDQPNGWFRYNHKPSRVNSAWPTLPASTPAAAFCLLLLGAGKEDTMVRGAVDWTAERRPEQYRRYGNDDFVLRGQGNVYFWYYGTLACFLAGGDAWAQWNERLRTVLPAAQNNDGSWTPIDVYAEQAGDNRRDRSYTTAMCVLCLEVYYRYFTPLLLGR